MGKTVPACLAALGVVLLSQWASGSEITTPPQDGVTITTTIDTADHTVIYGFDLTSLPYDYEQIAFSPAPLPAFSGIPLQPGAVSSPGLTEWNFHQMFDGGVFVGWQLELQYATGSPPPRSNTVTIQYNPATALSGGFIRLPGEENVTVTLRRPAGGFPAGQEDNVPLWAYVPEILPDPGDADKDGSVTDDDLSLLLAHWGQDVTADPDGGWAKGEFDATAPVDDNDLSLLLANWTGTGAAVPEPSAMSVLIASALLLLRRKGSP